MAAETPGRSSAYRRRHALPALLVLVVLGVATIFTWTVVLAGNSTGSDGSCNLPSAAPDAAADARQTRPAATVLGQPQPPTALDAQQPAPPAAVRVRVLNGAGQRGQAQLAASELGELGFGEAAEPANDPLYPNQDLACFGQIRYGAAGAAAARTLSLVVPCAELARDDRSDDAVDLSLGKDFRDINPSKVARDALGAIARSAAAEPRGGQQGEPPPATGLDADQLNALRAVTCST